MRESMDTQYLLKLRAGHSLSQAAIQDIVMSTRSLFSDTGRLDMIKDKIINALPLEMQNDVDFNKLFSDSCPFFTCLLMVPSLTGRGSTYLMFSSKNLSCKYEEKIFLTLANQKKELFFIIIIIIILYRGPYIDAYCQVWFHLAKLFQRIR
jgi:hypothetical protein